jgi:hypothetical protein
VNELTEWGLRTYCSEPNRGRQRWQRQQREQQAVYANRRRIRGERGLRLLRHEVEVSLVPIGKSVANALPFPNNMCRPELDCPRHRSGTLDTCSQSQLSPPAKHHKITAAKSEEAGE